MEGAARRWRRSFLLLVIWLSALGATPLALQAGAPASAACDSPMSPGSWTGSFRLVEGLELPGGAGTVRVTSSGKFTLEVSCGGGVTGTWTVRQRSELGFGDATCTVTPARSRVRSGTVTAGPGGLPVLELSSSTTGPARVRCTGGGRIDQTVAEVVPTGIRLVASRAGATSVGGSEIEWTAPRQYVRARRTLFTTVTSSGTWQLTGGTPPTPRPTAAPPMMSGLSSQYERIFLQGVPLMNTFRVSVDWGEGSPGTVRFTLGQLPPQAGTADAGGRYTASFDLGGLDATSTLTVTAQNPDGSSQLTRDVVIAQRPPWAQALEWVARPATAIVIYTSSVKVPPQPLTGFSRAIDERIPVIGGIWGLTPTQFTANLAADSSGSTLTSSRVTSTGGLTMGRETVALDPRGRLRTRLIPETVDFVDGTINADLARPLSISTRVGLGSLIPGWDSLTSGSGVLGRALQRLEPGIDLAATADAAAEGTLGVVDGTRLDFTTARATLQLTASASTGASVTIPSISFLGVPETVLFDVGIEVKIDGRASGAIAPTVAFESCTVELTFRAWARSDLAGSAEPAPSTWPIGLC